MTENSAPNPIDLSNFQRIGARHGLAQTARDFLKAEERRREAKRERQVLALKQAEEQGRQL